MTTHHDTLTPEDQNLINRIKAKIQNGKTITLMQEVFRCESFLYPPAPLSEIEQAEVEIGFKLPALIREIFLQVGNGGFGPGYGITGVINGMKIYDFSLVENVKIIPEYKDYHYQTLKDLERLLDSGEVELAEYQREKRICEAWKDVEQFVWYCYWGCNVTTLVDCANPDLPVYAVDAGDMHLHSSKTLRQWWRDWLDGTIQQY